MADGDEREITKELIRRCRAEVFSGVPSTKGGLKGLLPFDILFVLLHWVFMSIVGQGIVRGWNNGE